MILATQCGRTKITRPASQITQVKEFTSASEAPTRRITRKVQGSSENDGKSPNSEERGKADEGDVAMFEDERVDARMKSREHGKASILAWAETEGRYLDE